MASEQDLDPTLGAFEHEALIRASEELDGDRPVPNAAFRGALLRHLNDDGATAARHRPQHLWPMVAGLAGGGLVLLAVAAVNVV